MKREEETRRREAEERRRETETKQTETPKPTNTKSLPSWLKFGK